MNRYATTPIVNGVRASARTSQLIYNAVKTKNIAVVQRPLKEGERLDSIAGKVYGNATYWWVIAAASGIGWGCQVPPGTWLRIPVNLSDVMGLMGVV